LGEERVDGVGRVGAVDARVLLERPLVLGEPDAAEEIVTEDLVVDPAIDGELLERVAAEIPLERRKLLLPVIEPRCPRLRRDVVEELLASSGRRRKLSWR
jgi:hypothetical protein